jgi:adenosine deaminase
MGLEAALACFQFTLSLMQDLDTVTRVAAEVCEDAAGEGVSTLEIRFAPQLHDGGSVGAVIDAALRGIDGRAGLILCGLYGEPPEILLALVGEAKSRPEVVGIDLAGGPLDTHRWRLADYAPAFCRAAELGIGRTVHAGEGRPPAEIKVAIDQLHAQRIGHGTTILADPSAVALALERDVTLEACVTSNVQTGVIARIEEHPLPQWLELGLKACVCVDNTLFSDLSAPEELQRVGKIPGMNQALTSRLVACGHESAFRR